MADNPIDRNQGDNVISLRASKAPKDLQEGSRAFSGDNRPLRFVEESLAQLERLDERMEFWSCDESTEQMDKLRLMDRRRDVWGRLVLTEVKSHDDAMAALRLLMRDAAGRAEEKASTSNTMAFHLLSQVHTFLYRLQLKSLADAPDR